MAGTSRTAPLLRQTGRLVALIALGLAVTIHPATSDKARPNGAPESASLPPNFDSSSDIDAMSPEIVLNRKARKGDTLATILTRAGAGKSEAQDIIIALSKVYDPRVLSVGDEVSIVFERVERFSTGRLLAVDLPYGTDYVVHATRVDDDTFKAFKTKKALSQTMAHANGTIESSFYVDGAKAGLNAEMLGELVKIFRYDVDFQRDLQPGDTFDVLYQRVSDDEGAFVRRGDIIYAALTLSGVRRAFYLYRAPGSSSPEYYNAKGESVRKALLRTPLDAAKISSPFGNRMHPILGYTRMHRGVDFAAPTGTPIYAAGNASVVEAGRKGGYGIYARLRHDGGYETAYGHMRALAKGLKPGTSVHQGQIIGYVGATGEATGPHLHYEVLARGQQLNPLGVKFSGGRVLAGRELTAFAAARAGIDRWLAAMPGVTKVSTR